MIASKSGWINIHFLLKSGALTLRHIHFINTAVGSDNLGDEIIVAEIEKHLRPLISDAYVSTSSGHDGLGVYSRPIVSEAQIALLMGTNALTALRQQRRKFIWQVQRQDIPILKNKVVLLGVGANRDFAKVDRKQIKFLRSVLSHDYLHSVRDETALRILEACDLRGVNTSCPTLWSQPALAVPGDRVATKVCFTLTKHKSDPLDAQMIQVLQDAYDEVWFWPQQPRDLAYMQQISASSSIKLLPANLSSYDRFLRENDVDVIGTRLHGSIRGLHHGRRSLAIIIDNRARDIGRETGLPTLDRALVATDLKRMILGDLTPNLTIPTGEIERFLQQFSPN